MREQVTVEVPSDLELMTRVRSGDPAAGQVLMDRHRRAVTRLHAGPGAGLPEATAYAVLMWAREGDGNGLPFRAAWLAQQATGAIPDLAEGDADVVWSAYSSLPAAWRLAVWHREVEAQRPERIAEFLGMSEEETVRALASAYAALKRSVARHHTTGRDDECESLADEFRFTPPAFLSRRQVRLLREHGRRCDGCMGLIRDLFVVEYSLRTALADRVLGPAGADYLRGRRVARLRQSVAVAAPAPRPRLRPLVGSLATGAVAAAALTLVLAGPTPFRIPGEDTVSEAGPTAPGLALETQGESVERAAPRGLFGTPSATPPRGDDASPGAEPVDGQDPDGADGPGSPGDDPSSPSDPSDPDPTDPENPGEPGGETPPVGEGPDGDGGDGGPLDVDVDEEDVTVSVDSETVPGDDPVVIEVPLPDAEDVPDLPLPSVPGLPVLDGSS
jgi:DNA-directed RNA polymerase specialized sigma24 family protein